MTIQWEAYDTINWFGLFDAACLWHEFEPSMGVALKVPPSVAALFHGMKRLFLVMRHQFPDYFREPNGVYGNLHISDSMDVLYYRDPEKYYFPYLIKRQLLIEHANSVGEKPKFLFPEERNSSRGIPDLKDGEPESIPLPRRHDPRYAKHRQIVVELLVYAAQCHPEDRNSVGKLSQVAVQRGISIHKATIRRHLKDIFGMDKDLEKDD